MELLWSCCGAAARGSATRRASLSSRAEGVGVVASPYDAARDNDSDALARACAFMHRPPISTQGGSRPASSGTPRAARTTDGETDCGRTWRET